MPLATSLLAVLAVARLLPVGAGRTWWGLAALLATALVTAMAVERGTRRLLPVALLLKLSVIFPDRAPSRLRLARAAATSTPHDELLWTGTAARPTSTAELVTHLVSALGAHDRRTRGHSERVRLLCDMLAVELKLDQDARDRLRWSALLHDVGKIRVSTTILNKPGRLDDRELERIRQHPEAGAALAAPLMPWLGAWGEGIVDHHERYDGGGYPSGKAGEDISVAGRIIGLVDAFETMTAARAYKKAMATRAAREELARCAGTQFDPVLVRAFLAVSLPRVLWAMGPLSFLLQLPFLRPIAHAGVKGSAVAPQAAGALASGAAGAAGAAVIVTGGMLTPGSAAADVPGPVASAQRSAQEQPAAGRAAPGATAPEPRAVAGSDPADVEDPTPGAVVEPQPVGEPVPTPADAAAPAPPAEPAAARTRSPAEPARPGPRPTQDPAPDARSEPTDDPPPTSPAPEPEPTAQPTAAPEPDPAAEQTPTAQPGPTSQPSAPPGPPSEPIPATEPEPTPPDQPAPSSEPEPAPPSHPAVVSGPPAVTSSREAVFEFTPGTVWECQLLANAGGESSRPTPCSGTWTVDTRSDGPQVLRITDPVSGEVLEPWRWSVVPTVAQARAAADWMLEEVAAPVVAGPHRPDRALALLSLLAAAGLPFAAVARRVRARRG